MNLKVSVLIALLLIPVITLAAFPIRTQVPIYIPANLPVTGVACLPSPLASGLKAKLYVDNSFVEEGSANETGCYIVTIPPLTPGKHLLYAEIFKGNEKVAEITAEIIAITGMIVAKPDPLAVMKRGEKREVMLYIENRSPINLSDVKLDIEAPVPIFGYHMMRVRNFVISGKIGDLLVNSTKEVKVILAVPSTMRPGTYQVKLNLTYEIADSSYTVPLKLRLEVLEEVAVPAAQGEPNASIENMAEEFSIEEPTPLPLVVMLLLGGLVAIALLLYVIRKL